ncbi:MAG: 2-polyprenyl-3-methyl-5-hydroxy-6-metoxy-1,4-benzoquinol methylase [Acidimicrobiales bacterium]|jgi:2-polyprenyl-3-methyl-5-hydroxy-6-metoxy-1,4-benzoquinol methylase
MHKALRVIKKILIGKNPLEVRLPEGQWDRQFESGYWDFLLKASENVRTTVAIVETIAVDGPVKILDVGCGNGIIPQLLSEKEISFTYTGTDISQKALDQAKSQYPKGNYIHADIEEDPVLTDKYDVIIFSEVLLYGNSRTILLAHKKYAHADTQLIISLYRTWRTIIIWFLIQTSVRYISQKRVINPQKTISWDVKVATYKK